MAVSKHIFSGLDFAVAAVTTGLPNNLDATALPWGSKEKLNSQSTGHALGESSWPLISQKETPLQPTCLTQASSL